MKRLLCSFATSVAVLILMVPGAARADSPSDAATFVRLVNELRARQGAPALQVHPELEAKAAAWAGVMADARRIWHSDLADGITANWSGLAENVGMGGNIERLHEAFVASPRHYDNLIKASHEYVGIAVVEADGVLYVAQEFMTLNRPAPAPGPAPAPAPSVPAPAAVAATPAPAVATPATVPAPPRAAPVRRTPSKPASSAPSKPAVAGQVMHVTPSPTPTPAAASAPTPAPVPAAAEAAATEVQPAAVELTTEATAGVSAVPARTSWLAFLLILAVAAGGLAVQIVVRGGRRRASLV